jgi:antitoxin PrlF
MAKKTASKTPASESCCGDDCCAGSGCCGAPAPGCCKVEAVVSLDGRGQMVLPKDVRELFGFQANEKLAVVAWRRNDTPCCLTLMKVDELAEAVRQTYGPVLREIVRG